MSELLTEDHSDAMVQSAGQGHAAQDSLSGSTTGLSSARQADSDTSTVCVVDTCCWQTTRRVRVPKPQVSEQDVQSVVCHL